MTLPACTYTLTLTHPHLEQPQMLEVALGSRETVDRTVEVAPCSADRYFEESWR